MYQGADLKEKTERSKEFTEFENYFRNPTSEPLFRIYSQIDQIILALNPVEKQIAEEILMNLLEEELDKARLYGLVALKTEDSDESYRFLLQLFQQEDDTYNKLQIAYTIVQMNEQAPVLNFLEEVLVSDMPRVLKMDAMGTISWLQGITFEDPNEDDKFQSILYSSMIDAIQDIRLYAYDILQNHLDLLHFTPLDNPIDRLLKTDGNQSEYHKAADMLREQLELKREMTFSRDLLLQFLSEIPDNPPSLERSECEICSDIPEDIEADVVEGESIDEYTSRLETILFMNYPLNNVKRCPNCGQLYIFLHNLEYHVHAIRDINTERLYCTTMEGMTEFIDTLLEDYEIDTITKCGIFHRIVPTRRE